jgi:stage V sporulation protein AD
VGSAYGLQGFDIPYIGLYGACSTCAESLLLSSLFVSYGMCNVAAAVTSSHYCSAERQYRTPLEYGAQRAPTAQWTVTGSGAFLVRGAGEKEPTNEGKAVVRRCLIGRVQDSGVADAANMGAAMVPAALDTLCRFLRETKARPEDYDLILTGDLGYEGGDILCSLMHAEGYDIDTVYNDCGKMIYDRERQDVHGGGSGCGCSAVVLSADILPKVKRGELSRILFLATGAMMSPDSLKQGEKVLAVAHLLEIQHVG